MPNIRLTDTVKIKRNDSGRVLLDILPLDVTGAVIVFVMRNVADSGNVFRIEGEIVDAPSGQVKVILGEDVLVLGATYQAEWEITFTVPPGVITIPQDSYHTVEVVPDLGEESA